MNTQTYGERFQEWLRLMEVQPESPYEIIEAQNQQIALLQQLLTESRLNEARLIAQIDDIRLKHAA